MVGKVKSADIIIRAGCNLRCKHCFAGDSKRQDYDIDKAFEIFDELKSKGYDVFTYPLELPFLYGTPDFEKVMKLYQMCEKKWMLTNGVLIGQKPEILDEIRMYGIEELSIGNVEGIDAETQNKVTGQGETLEYTLKGIKNAAERGFKKVGVYSVLNKANRGQAREMCNMVKAAGADSILFLRLVPMGQAKGISDLMLSADEVEDFIREVYTTMRPKNEDFEVRLSCNFGPDLHSRRTLEYIEKFGRVCFPTNPGYIAIEPLKRGTVQYKCFFGMGEPDMIKTDMTEQFDVNKLKGKCGDCDVKESCGGGCRMLAYKLTGDFYGSMDVCRTQVIEKYGLRNIKK